LASRVRGFGHPFSLTPSGDILSLDGLEGRVDLAPSFAQRALPKPKTSATQIHEMQNFDTRVGWFSLTTADACGEGHFD